MQIYATVHGIPFLGHPLSDLHSWGPYVHHEVDQQHRKISENIYIVYIYIYRLEPDEIVVGPTSTRAVSAPARLFGRRLWPGGSASCHACQRERPQKTFEHILNTSKRSCLVLDGFGMLLML